jgi:AcrR family transcriptional regulator
LNDYSVKNGIFGRQRKSPCLSCLRSVFLEKKVEGKMYLKCLSRQELFIYIKNFFTKVTKKTIRQQRKADIIKAFYQVAKKEGLENASIAKVAERAKINPSLVMHYFKTRDELMLSLNHFILERYLNIYKINGSIVDSREKLIELIENLFSRKWNRLFDDGVFYSCYAQIYRNKEFKKSFKKLHDSLHQKLQRSLDEAVENQVWTSKTPQK